MSKLKRSGSAYALPDDFVRQFVAEARHSLSDHHLPRIKRCLEILTAKQTWWRPHATSNSIGNLVLHLAGNVRQWLVCGLGGDVDRRERDKEFSESGPLPRKFLLSRLQDAVRDADRVLTRISAADLAREYHIQGFKVTGLVAIYHVTEHFAHHTGQILYATKLQTGKNLRFTHLPADKKNPAGSARKLSPY